MVENIIFHKLAILKSGLSFKEVSCNGRRKKIALYISGGEPLACRPDEVYKTMSSVPWGSPRVQKFGSRGMVAVFVGDPLLSNFWMCGEPHGLDDLALSSGSHHCTMELVCRVTPWMDLALGKGSCVGSGHCSQIQHAGLDQRVRLHLQTVPTHQPHAGTILPNNPVCGIFLVTQALICHPNASFTDEECVLAQEKNLMFLLND